MKRLVWGILFVILLAACSETEEGRKAINKYDYDRLLYFYPDFEEQQFINYNLDSEIILSEDVTWFDVVKGYEYQLNIAEDYNEKFEEIQNDYYKGIITGEEINEASTSLLALNNLLEYTVILPIDASPELRSIAENMNKTLHDMGVYVFGSYKLVFDDDKKVIEIDKTYNPSHFDFDELKERYNGYFAKLQEVVNERE